MARVNYGSIITGMKGSIGGITYQKNSSGSIARLRPKKTKNQTIRQNVPSSLLKQVQQKWNLLTLAEKNEWDNFGQAYQKIGLDGQTKKLSGYQWFLSLNLNATYVDTASLVEPPQYETVAPINNIIAIASSNYVYLRYNQAIDYNVYKPLVYSSYIESRYKKFNYKRNQLLGWQEERDNMQIVLATPQNDGIWNTHFDSPFPPPNTNKQFYLTAYIRFIKDDSLISSIAYKKVIQFEIENNQLIIVDQI